MQGDILIIDSIATNRIALKAVLKGAYYQVAQATNLAEAQAALQEALPDLIICASDLPDGTAVEFVNDLRATPRSAEVPTLVLGGQLDRETRISVLAAGAFDVIAQPVEEQLLLGRVRSLIKEHHQRAEWHMREDTCQALGLAEAAGDFSHRGTHLLVGTDMAQLDSYAGELRLRLKDKVEIVTARELIHHVTTQSAPDTVVLILSSDVEPARQELRNITKLRAAPTVRQIGVLAVQSQHDPAIGAEALDLGADDLMTDGFDAAELALRIKAVTRRKRMGAQLRASVRTGLQAAVFDPLTGLYNRRYAMPHLSRIAAHAQASAGSFAVLVADLDHFKRVNDNFGHASGDAVLVEVAHRLRRAVRSSDMIARTGGEEFIIILPNTIRPEAEKIAQRVCSGISDQTFTIPASGTPIEITISVGVAVQDGDALAQSAPEDVGRCALEQADAALYAAKGRGRNQVQLSRPAA